MGDDPFGDDGDDEFLREAIQQGILLDAAPDITDILSESTVPANAPPAAATSPVIVASPYGLATLLPEMPARAVSRPSDPVDAIKGVAVEMHSILPRSGGSDVSAKRRESAASSSSSSTACSARMRKEPSSSDGVDTGNFLRIDNLKTVSLQLSAPATKREAGLPVVMVAGAAELLVGMSHGDVLLFEHARDATGKTRFRLSVTFTHHGAGADPVSSIAVSPDAADGVAWVAVGHASGALQLLDRRTGKSVKTLNTGHTTAVAGLAFVGDRTVLVSSDVAGAVVVTTLSRVLYVLSADSQTLIAAPSAGPVHALAALVPLRASAAALGALAPTTAGTASRAHPLDQRCLLALATAKKLVVFALRPVAALLVKTAHPSGASASSLSSSRASASPSGTPDRLGPSPPTSADAVPPCSLAWRPRGPGVGGDAGDAQEDGDGASSRSSGGSSARGSARSAGTSEAAVLAVGSATVITFLQASAGSDGEIEFVSLYRHRTDAPVCGVQWIASAGVAPVLAYINTRQQLRVVDVSAREELATVDVRPLDLVFSDRFAPRLRSSPSNDGARMSSGWSMAAGRKCLFLLGLQQVHAAALATWTQRIAALVQRGDFLGALSLALEFHQGRARLVVGLPSDPENARAVTAAQISTLVLSYIDLFVATHRPQQGNAVGSSPARPAGLASPMYSGAATANPHVVSTAKRTQTEGAGTAGKPPSHAVRTAHVVIKETPPTPTATVADFGEPSRTRDVGVLGGAKRTSGEFGEEVDLFLAEAETELARDAADRLAEALVERYRTLATVCLEYYLGIGAPRDLLGGMYDRFRAAGAGATLLELLEPLVLRGKVAAAPPHVLQDFVALYRERGWDSRLQEVVLHMDIASLDFHQVVTACRDAGLWDALIYLFNKGVGDYTTPLSDMVSAMAGSSDAARVGSEGARAVDHVGFRLLLCLSHYLLGKAYPVGDLPPRRAAKVKAEVLQWLFAAGPDGAVPLRALLLFDCAATLRVLSIVMEDKAIFQAREEGPARPRRAVVLSLLTVVLLGDHNAALPLATSDTSQAVQKTEPRAPFSFRHVALVYEWVITQVLEGRIATSDAFMLEMVTVLVTHVPEELRARLRQQAAVVAALGRATLAPRQQHELLSLATLRGLHQVREVLYVRRGQYEMVVQCYLDDEPRKAEVFDRLRSLLKLPGISAEQLVRLKESILAALPALVRVDTEQAAALVVECFAGDHQAVMQHLEAHREVLFVYLRAILDDPAGSGALVLLPDGEERTQKRTLGAKMQTKYVDLLCEFAPDEVLKYLLAHDDYPLDECLAICRRRGVTDATAYLLERTGEVLEALALITAKLDEQIGELRAQADAQIPGPLLATVRAAVALCQRNQAHTDSQALWFSLLDRVLAPLGSAVEAASPRHATRSLLAQTRRAVLTGLATTILDAMTGHVPVSAIMDKIISDHSRHAFWEFRDVILGILDTYKYEGAMMETTKLILARDCHSIQKKLVRRLTRPARPRRPLCEMCMRPLSTPSRSGATGLRVHHCGHGFHESCVAGAELCPLCVHDERGKREAAPNNPAREAPRNVTDSYADRLGRFASSQRGLPSDGATFGTGVSSSHALVLAPPVLKISSRQRIGERPPPGFVREHPKYFNSVLSEDLFRQDW